MSVIAPFSLDAYELQKYQPNRYPMLMIDYVTEVVPGSYAKGYKNLTNNEWFFPKHFEGHPNMPGCLQLEAMAQMLTVAITTQEGLSGRAMHAVRHQVQFHKEVFPGDRLELTANVISWRHGMCVGKAEGWTNGTKACEAKMWIIIPEIFKSYLPKDREKDT